MMFLLTLNNCESSSDRNTSALSVSYNELIDYKQDCFNIQGSSFLRGTQELSLEYYNLKTFHNMFSNTYTEYALKSNKLFFYIEVSSPNFTYKNCMSSTMRGKFAKVVANKIINGLLKHFSGMVDLIFADLSCERDNLSNFLEVPKFKFIITFNTYFLPKNTSVAFRDSAFVKPDIFYYLSEHNGLDFFFNNLAHLVELDDNCPFTVSFVEHLHSQIIITKYWQKFFFLHGDALNLVHIFFYSATSPIWFNLEDPTFYPFVSCCAGDFSVSSSPNYDLLTFFSFLTLADSISTDSKNIFRSTDFNSIEFLDCSPFLQEEVCYLNNSDSDNKPYFNESKLNYGLSFLVRGTLSLPYIYDQFWSYCGHRCRRKEDNFFFLYDDNIFESVFFHLISTYFMLQGVQFSPAGGFVKINPFSKNKYSSSYPSFVPFEDAIICLERISAPAGLISTNNDALCGVSYFLKHFMERVYINLLSVLPELKYYINKMQFISYKDLSVSNNRDAFSVRTNYHEVIVRGWFDKLYSNYKETNSVNFLVFVLDYFLDTKLFDLKGTEGCFSGIFLDYGSTPDGYACLRSGLLSPILVFPAVGCSNLKMS